MSSTYKEDGVNIEVGDDFSSMAGKMCKNTFENSPFVKVADFAEGNFRGPRAFKLINLPEDHYLEAAPDGVGTKVVIIDSAFSHRKAMQDVIAMTASDITRWGGKPLVFVNVLDVATLGTKDSNTNNCFKEMVDGLGEIAKDQEFVCFRGETAELGLCVGSDNDNALTKFNIAGFMIGAYLPDRMITGSTLAPGQVVVALQENGFRSNGISSVRKAFKMQFNDNWWDNPEAFESIELAATPSVLYDKFLTRANGWYDGNIVDPLFNIHLITHVSGGGIVDKFFKDMLKPLGLSADLDDLFSPPQIMKDVANWRNIPPHECYQTFNGGNGMLVVIDRSDVFDFVGLAKIYGINAQTCGEIIDRPVSGLKIQDKFNNYKILKYT